MEKDNSKTKAKGLEKFKENPWIIATTFLSILVLIFLISDFSTITGGFITGGSLSGEEVGKRVANFAESQVGQEVLLEEVNKEGNFYEVVLSIQGQEFALYATKDGKYMTQSLIPLESKITQPAQTEIPKSDKPEVELFIWSYCPYGVLAQGPLAEVANLLGDKVNFKSIMYYDGHGDYETQQNKIQACIQKNEPEKYWNYAAGFVEDIYPACSTSGDIACDKRESIKVMNSLGIDTGNILSCVDSEGADLIAEDSNYAGSLGVTGSPTVIINGVKANVARNAESYKDAVCKAFNNAPEECGTVLDSTSVAASGNC